MRAAPLTIVFFVAGAAHAQMTFESRLSDLTVTSTGGGTRSASFSGFEDYYDRVTFGSPEGVADQTSALRGDRIFSTTLARGSQAGPGDAHASSSLSVIFTTETGAFWWVEGIHAARLGQSLVALTDLDSGDVLFSSSVDQGSRLLESTGRLNPGRYRWSVQSFGDAEGEATSTASLFVVPSPGALLLLGLGVFFLRPARKLFGPASPL